ncbi:hypothetical protein [Peribacillus sp. SCS-37]|uniref:hypothetical protein n=1 Tax=Paraperibacillus esterisolvens TaxID=3115296 RepID=UPI00390612EA
MTFDLPDINKMSTIEAIHWYTARVVEVTSVKNRIAGTFSEEYKAALMVWKKELNNRVIAEKHCR